MHFSFGPRVTFRSPSGLLVGRGFLRMTFAQRYPHHSPAPSVAWPSTSLVPAASAASTISMMVPARPRCLRAIQRPARRWQSSNSCPAWHRWRQHGPPSAAPLAKQELATNVSQRALCANGRGVRTGPLLPQASRHKPYACRRVCRTCGAQCVRPSLVVGGNLLDKISGFQIPFPLLAYEPSNPT